MDLGVYGVNKVFNDALRGEGFKHISFGDVSEKDLNKQSIFPLAHLTLLSNRLTPAVNFYTYEIYILDVVDVNTNNPRESKNELSLTTNIEDVFHDLSFKFNRAWQTVTQNN